MPPKGPVQAGLNTREGFEFMQAHVGPPPPNKYAHIHSFSIIIRLCSGFLACVQHFAYKVFCSFLDPRGEARPAKLKI